MAPLAPQKSINMWNISTASLIANNPWVAQPATRNPVAFNIDPQELLKPVIPVMNVIKTPTQSMKPMSQELPASNPRTLPNGQPIMASNVSQQSLQKTESKYLSKADLKKKLIDYWVPQEEWWATIDALYNKWYKIEWYDPMAWKITQAPVPVAPQITYGENKLGEKSFISRVTGAVWQWIKEWAKWAYEWVKEAFTTWADEYANTTIKRLEESDWWFVDELKRIWLWWLDSLHYIWQIAWKTVWWAIEWTAKWVYKWTLSEDERYRVKSLFENLSPEEKQRIWNIVSWVSQYTAPVVNKVSDTYNKLPEWAKEWLKLWVRAAWDVADIAWWVQIVKGIAKWVKPVYQVWKWLITNPVWNVWWMTADFRTVAKDTIMSKIKGSPQWVFYRGWIVPTTKEAAEEVARQAAQSTTTKAWVSNIKDVNFWKNDKDITELITKATWMSVRWIKTAKDVEMKTQKAKLWALSINRLRDQITSLPKWEGWKIDFDALELDTSSQTTLANAASEWKQKVWSMIENSLDEATKAKATIDSTPLVKAITDQMSQYVDSRWSIIPWYESAQKEMEKILTFITQDWKSRIIPIWDAQKLSKALNEASQSIYKWNPNPASIISEAVNSHLRPMIDDAVESYAWDSWVSDLKRMYWALKEFEWPLARRWQVLDRSKKVWLYDVFEWAWIIDWVIDIVSWKPIQWVAKAIWFKAFREWVRNRNDQSKLLIKAMKMIDEADNWSIYKQPKSKPRQVKVEPIKTRSIVPKSQWMQEWWVATAMIYPKKPVVNVIEKWVANKPWTTKDIVAKLDQQIRAKKKWETPVKTIPKTTETNIEPKNLDNIPDKKTIEYYDNINKQWWSLKDQDFRNNIETLTYDEFENMSPILRKRYDKLLENEILQSDDFNRNLSKLSKEVQNIEEIEKRIWKVWKNKVIEKSYIRQQESERIRKKEKLIERISEETGLDQFEASNLYDDLIDYDNTTTTQGKTTKSIITQKEKGVTEKVNQELQNIAKKVKEKSIAKKENGSIMDSMKNYKTFDDYFNSLTDQQLIDLKGNANKTIIERSKIRKMWDDANPKTVISKKEIPVKKVEVKKDDNLLTNLNPTWWLYVKYDPAKRASMKLADNITTLDKTMWISPEKEITIYRWTVKSQNDIVPWDFVTTSKELAKSYAGEWKVIEMKVKASDVLDDINEPLGDEYIYRPKLSPKSDTPIIPKDLKPLYDEAKKYKSADEFVDSLPVWGKEGRSIWRWEWYYLATRNKPLSTNIEEINNRFWWVLPKEIKLYRWVKWNNIIYWVVPWDYLTTNKSYANNFWELQEYTISSNDLSFWKWNNDYVYIWWVDKTESQLRKIREEANKSQ